MMIQRANLYRLEPTLEQDETLSQWAGEHSAAEIVDFMKGAA